MSRQEAITTERRRRNPDSLTGLRQKLGVTAELDRDNFEYRWANDDGTRIHDLTVKDDWEVVSDRSGKLKPDGAGAGAEVAVPVGLGGSGAPVKAILLRKPKAFYEDDKRAEQRRIDETEAGMKQGVTPNSGQDAQAYVPRGGIVFETSKG